MPVTKTPLDLELPSHESVFDEAELAAVAFLARYSGRTLDAYRQDLRSYFTWAAGSAFEVLAATRPHVELYRHHMEQRGLAASTIDRRLSTVCGFYWFAHIDGRITSNPAQYVRRPKVHPPQGRGLDRGELGRFLFTAERVDRHHAALAVLLGLNGLRVTEACDTNIEDLGFDRGHRILKIIGKGNKPAIIPLVPRTARTIDLAIGERTTGAILLRRDGSRFDRRTATPVGSFDRPTRQHRRSSPTHAPSGVHHGRTRRWCAATRRADRSTTLRPANHHHLRPQTRELRPTRRLRRRRIRRRRVTIRHIRDRDRARLQ